MEQRVELHLHTVMSEDSSVITPGELIETAVAQGLPAVAVTCRNSVQDFPELEAYWQHCGRKLKVIYGAEVCYRKGNRICSIALLAQNGAGLKGLYKVLSSMHRQYGPKTVDWEIIEKYRMDLLLGCPTWLVTELDDTDESLRLYDYIAITPTGRQDEQQRQWALYSRAKEWKIPVVAVGNCHYLNAADSICRKVLNHVGREDAYEAPTPLRNTEDMLRAVSYLGEDVAWETVVTNPGRIADLVETVYPTFGDFPAFTLPEGEETVARHCNEKLEALYGKTPPEEIKTRLDTELLLLGCDASQYLVAHRLAKYLQDKGAITGCRGTIASTLTAYLLDISDVNPLPAHYRCPACHYTEFADAVSGFDLPEKACPHCGKSMVRDGHNIPYETALGVDGGNDPLIDLSTPKTMQQEALRFLAEDLGADRVALAGAACSFQRKLAEAYARVYAYQAGENFSSEALAHIVRKLSWVKKQEGMLPMGKVLHPQWLQPFGVVLRPEELEWEDITPMRPLDDPENPIGQVTHMDYYRIDHALPKLDVLHYGIYDRLMRLFALTGTKPEDVDYTDPEVYRLFWNLDTCGLPEFASDFCRDILSRLEKIQFSDLIRVCGMAHSTAGWVENGAFFHSEGHTFRELIGDRDDVFLLLRKYGLDRRTAYTVMTTVRKGRFHPDNPRYQSLKEKLKEAGVPDWYIESMEKICYLFPKAHSAHYVKMAVTCAWFKVHYPEVFYDVTLENLGAEAFSQYSDGDLEKRLKSIAPEDYSRHREQEAIALLLEARHRGYREPVED